MSDFCSEPFSRNNKVSCQNSKVIKNNTYQTKCNKTKLQDLYLVLVAMALFLILANPWCLTGLNYIINNKFLAFIASLLIFGGLLYLIYIFMP